MNYTIHVPPKFKNLESLKKIATRSGLSMAQLNENSLSFEVGGPKEKLDNFLHVAESYDNVHALGHGSKPVAKNYIRLAKLHSHSSPKAAPTYFTAKELGSVYNISATTPANRTGVAVIELGGGYKQSDLTAYWNYLGLSTQPVVHAMSVDGATNSPGNSADFEVVLDIEAIGGICPNSNIYVYFAPNTDKGFYDAINAAIFNPANPVSVVSISWGAPENEWSASTLNSFNSLFQQATTRGVTICVASGDSGSSDGESGLHVDFPASSPWVLACGGTRLSCPNRVYLSPTTQEIVWGTVTGNGASGGGFSSVFQKPVYQIAATAKYLQTGRGVPDVCGNADPGTGWLIYINGAYYVIGGTSAVAPMWAGYLTSISFKQFLNPILYTNYALRNSIVHDITVGNDGSYTAAVGWDPASGLGSPNGQSLTPILTGITG